MCHSTHSSQEQRLRFKGVQSSCVGVQVSEFMHEVPGWSRLQAGEMQEGQVNGMQGRREGPSRRTQEQELMPSHGRKVTSSVRRSMDYKIPLEQQDKRGKPHWSRQSARPHHLVSPLQQLYEAVIHMPHLEFRDGDLQGPHSSKMAKLGVKLGLSETESVLCLQPHVLFSEHQFKNWGDLFLHH